MTTGRTVIVKQASTTIVATAATGPRGPAGEIPADVVRGAGVTHIVSLTQAAYDALVLAGDIDPFTFYAITA